SPRSQHIVIVNYQRSVIGESPVRVDRRRARRRGDTRRRDLVIDAPADVLRPGLAAIRPPGVLLGLAIDPPKDVDKAQFVEYPREPRPFFRQEPGILLVAAPV